VLRVLCGAGRWAQEGLSFALDGTLRSGEHDMKVFGLGFLRSVASRAAHVHFTTSMLHWYQVQYHPRSPSRRVAQLTREAHTRGRAVNHEGWRLHSLWRRLLPLGFDSSRPHPPSRLPL
jgi:hypothetical protein